MEYDDNGITRNALCAPKLFMTFDCEELLITESFRLSTMKSLGTVNHLLDTAIPLFKYTFHIFGDYREHFSWHEQTLAAASVSAKGMSPDHF